MKTLNRNANSFISFISVTDLHSTFSWIQSVRIHVIFCSPFNRACLLNKCTYGGEYCDSSVFCSGGISVVYRVCPFCHAHKVVINSFQRPPVLFLRVLLITVLLAVPGEKGRVHRNWQNNKASFLRQKPEGNERLVWLGKMKVGGRSFFGCTDSKTRVFISLRPEISHGWQTGEVECKFGLYTPNHNMLDRVCHPWSQDKRFTTLLTDVSCQGFGKELPIITFLLLHLSTKFIYFIYFKYFVFIVNK